MATDKPKRVVFYLRVSTKEQTVENQKRDLEEAAAMRGWVIVGIYQDEGISGAKGRDKRPGLDKLLKDSARGGFDVVAVWAVDRIGRSMVDLISTLNELRHTKKDLFILKQQLDTTTPAGRAMFGMLGIFSEFERDMICERVHAGLARARAKGIVGGRPCIPDEVKESIAEYLHQGYTSKQIQALLGVGTSTVDRIRQAMERERREAA
jgi:DNA invertase Pin-like site-specific DNA recombinase